MKGDGVNDELGLVIRLLIVLEGDFDLSFLIIVIDCWVLSRIDDEVLDLSLFSFYLLFAKLCLELVFCSLNVI